MNCRYCESERTHKNCEKSSGSDVVYVSEGVVQLFGQRDISSFSDNDDGLDKESVGRDKMPEITDDIKKIEIDEIWHFICSKKQKMDLQRC